MQDAIKLRHQAAALNPLSVLSRNRRRLSSWSSEVYSLFFGQLCLRVARFPDMKSGAFGQLDAPMTRKGCWRQTTVPVAPQRRAL